MVHPAATLSSTTALPIVTSSATPRAVSAPRHPHSPPTALTASRPPALTGARPHGRPPSPAPALAASPSHTGAPPTVGRVAVHARVGPARHVVLHHTAQPDAAWRAHATAPRRGLGAGRRVQASL
eukprot:2628319-Prymnesium_polylepis.1